MRCTSRARLKTELEWLKKKLACSTEDRRGWAEPEHPEISIWRQCDLLGLSRASLYYDPVEESRENLLLMRVTRGFPLFPSRGGYGNC